MTASQQRNQDARDEHLATWIEQVDRGSRLGNTDEDFIDGGSFGWVS